MLCYLSHYLIQHQTLIKTLNRTSMSTVNQHYSQVLADVYSWMFGGFESGIQKNHEFFKNHKIKSVGSGIAIDLGAGCGFQSIPLAQIGFSVTAIDLEKNC